MILLYAVNGIPEDPAIITIKNGHLLPLRSRATCDKRLVLHFLCAEVLRQQMGDDEVDDIVIVYGEYLRHLGKGLTLPKDVQLLLRYRQSVRL